MLRYKTLRLVNSTAALAIAPPSALLIGHSQAAVLVCIILNFNPSSCDRIHL